MDAGSVGNVGVGIGFILLCALSSISTAHFLPVHTKDVQAQADQEAHPSNTLPLEKLSNKSEMPEFPGRNRNRVVETVEYYEMTKGGSNTRFSFISFPSVVKLNLRHKQEEELYSSFWIYLLIIFFGLVIIASFVLGFYIIRVSIILICGSCHIHPIPQNLAPILLPYQPRPTSHINARHTNPTFNSVPLHLANYADIDQ